MYDVMELSLKSCTFIIQSMFADQRYTEVVRTHGESNMRELKRSSSTLSPKNLSSIQWGCSNSAFNSNSYFFSYSSSLSRHSP